MNNSNKIQKNILEISLKNIIGQIDAIISLQSSMDEINDKIRLQINSLKKEQEKMQRQLDEFEFNNGINIEENSTLDKINKKYDNNTADQNSLQQEIQDLNMAQGNSKRSSTKRIIQLKIDKKQEKLEKLISKTVKFDERQRSILISKQDKLNKKNALLSKQEAKIDMTNEKIEDNMLLSSLEPNNLVNKVKGKIYQKQLDYQTSILSIMKSSNVNFKGANVMIINKNISNIKRKAIAATSIIKSNIGNAFISINDELKQMVDESYNSNENTNQQTIGI